MAALRFDLEIDGAVHPELYQTLAAVDSEHSRAERLRQLASTGLIWERLRLANDEMRADGDPARDAEIWLEPVHPHSAGAHSRSNGQAIPVLRDEVLKDQFPPHLRRQPPRGLIMPAAADVPARRDEDSAENSSPTVQMTGTRSRLMRMKSRGLFKNE
jgi:hypothetical protein